MKTYIVTAPMGATLTSGILRLAKGQVRRRVTQVKALGNDLYEIKTPTTFKCGEKFGYEGQPSKVLMTMIEDEEQAKAEAAEKKAAEAKKAEAEAKGKKPEEAKRK